MLLRLTGKFRTMNPSYHAHDPVFTMALLNDEPTLSARRLLLVGIPSLLAAVTISLIAHQEAHRIGDALFCGDASTSGRPAVSLLSLDQPHGSCGMSSLAGQVWTFGLAVISFVLLVRFPRNLFLMSMAFINATARLPETVTVFLQYLINSKTALHVDESASLSLIGLSDPTIPTVVMCFYSLLLLFFSIIVVHDVKVVRYKWPIAIGLFLCMGYIEHGVIWMISPLLQG
jgi:hypothetical protein